MLRANSVVIWSYIILGIVKSDASRSGNIPLRLLHCLGSTLYILSALHLRLNQASNYRSYSTHTSQLGVEAGEPLLCAALINLLYQSAVQLQISALFSSCSYFTWPTAWCEAAHTQSLQSLVHFPCASERLFLCVHGMTQAVLLWLIKSIGSCLKPVLFH